MSRTEVPRLIGRSRPGSEPVRGQAGITLIELLIVVLVSSVVLVPVFGIVNMTLLRQRPTVQTANDLSQMRLFRTQIAQDWAPARVIKIDTNAGLSSDQDCGPNGTASSPLIAIQTAFSPAGRIVYKTRTATNGAGGIDVIRRECLHVSRIADFGLDFWDTGTATTSETVVLRNIQSFGGSNVVCNDQTNYPKNQPDPYQPCDANITVVGLRGERSTVRLYQEVGRKS